MVDGKSPKMFSEDKELVENMKLCYGEYMAGGFDEKWLKDEVKDIFDEMERYVVEDSDLPEELCRKWASIEGGIYK